MFDPEISDPLHIDERLVVMAGFLITSSMMVCLVANLTQFGRLILPGWRGAYLIVMGFIVALESLYSHRLLRNQYFTDPLWVSYRISEWVMIVVILKSLEILSVGSANLYAEINSWQVDFYQNFLDTETMFGLIALVFVWLICGRFAEVLVALEANERVLRQEVESGIYEDRSINRRRLSNLILLVGGVMVFLTALLRTDKLAEWFDLPIMRASVINTIIYFYLGFVLLSLSNFNLLRARWYRDKIVVGKDVAGRWLLYSGIFILLLALIARVLPTGYSIGLLAVLNSVFFAFIFLVNLILTVLVYPIFWLLGWLMSLFATGNEPGVESPLPMISEVPIPQPIEPVPWWELVKSILFWVVFLGIVAVSVVYYFRENRNLWDKLIRLPWLSSLARWIEWFENWLRGVNQQLGTIVSTGLQRLRAKQGKVSEGQSWRYINPRKLSPRDRVRFYYLALVRRGGEIGCQRAPSQTPIEYSEKLSHAIAFSDGEGTLAVKTPIEGSETAQPAGVVSNISLMTECFIKARYSLQLVNEPDAGTVQRAWTYLRKTLRRMRLRKEQN